MIQILLGLLVKKNLDYLARTYNSFFLYFNRKFFNQSKNLAEKLISLIPKYKEFHGDSLNLIFNIKFSRHNYIMKNHKII